MAENTYIKYNLTFKVKSDVTTVYKLILQSDDLAWGKWEIEPPNEIKVEKAGDEVTVPFEACGRACSSTGTQGSVVYKATDPDNTEYTLTFDIPYSKANTGNLTGGSEYFDTSGGQVPGSGSPTVDVKITQIKPTF